MGKSPGKWIKTILFGKKTSKSSLSKRREIPKSSYEKASSAPTEGLVSSVAVVPPFTSETAPVEIAGENKNLESGNVEVSRGSNELSRSSSKQDGDAERATNNGDPYDLDRIRLEQAATKAQATFRGYLARRAFRTLKGIIRLQAVIRGHLVRRQAVATLYCVHGIVKLQALVRGQMIRHSDIGGEVRRKQSLSRRETGVSDSRKANTYSQREKLLKNAFIRLLLSSSPTVMPLRLQYDPAEPNSAWNWLLRWTMSRVWGARCEPKKTTDLKEKVEPKKTIDLKQKVETKKVGQKHSGHKKQSANVENASSRPTSESEKLKHNPRKALNQSVKSVQEQPRSGTDKVKHNPKKASKFASEIPVQKDVGSEKPKSDLSKLSNPQVPKFSGDRSNNPSDKPIKDLEGIVSHSENEEKSAAVPHRDDTVNDLDGYLVSDVKHRQTSDKNETIIDVDRDLNSMEESIINENHKINRRRISLLAKCDDQETEQRGTRVPSYMSSTESAKAKVRGQVSPKLGQDVAEKDGLIRRHSLPSSINGKPSSSPRVQRLIQANGKGGLKIDRSLTSSRDSNDKVTQAEWRR